MAKLLGPDFISLQVRDISVSRTFYTEVLGLKIDTRFSAPGAVVFETSTIPFALRAASITLDDAPQPGWGMTLWLDCDQVDALYTQLATAGVTIVAPPSDGPFGRTIIFTDPDGYQITANENNWERFPLGGNPK